MVNEKKLRTKFTDEQVIFLINLWTSDVNKDNIESNLTRYTRYAATMNEKFGILKSRETIDSKIKSLRQAYNKVIIAS